MFFQLDTEGGARRGRAEKQAGALSLEPGPSARGMFVLLNPVCLSIQMEQPQLYSDYLYSNLLQPSPAWVGSGEEENWRTSNTRESGRFIRVGPFDGPQALTF